MGFRPRGWLLLVLAVAGWAIFLPAAVPIILRVTALALGAWFLHLVVHELAHLAVARAVNFQVLAVRLGPVLVTLWPARRVGLGGADLGGGVASRPRGLHRLIPRLRTVAAAGPLATLGLTLAGLGWYLAAGAPGLGTPPGIALVMGGFVLFTALFPGRWLPQPSPSGSDSDQLRCPRWVVSHWTYGALLQAVGDGKRATEVTSVYALGPLLPPEDEPTEPLELINIVLLFEAGHFDEGRNRLRSALERTKGAPQWLLTDLNTQDGALHALLDGDAREAELCLDEVRKHQTLDWYEHLLGACVAKAKGDEAHTRSELKKWLQAVEVDPRKPFALAGNHWILERLGVGSDAEAADLSA